MALINTILGSHTLVEGVSGLALLAVPGKVFPSIANDVDALLPARLFGLSNVTLAIVTAAAIKDDIRPVPKPVYGILGFYHGVAAVLGLHQCVQVTSTQALPTLVHAIYAGAFTYCYVKGEPKSDH